MFTSSRFGEQQGSLLKEGAARFAETKRPQLGHWRGDAGGSAFKNALGTSSL